MISLDFLEKVEVFKEFNDEQLTMVQSCSELAEFQRGERLFAEGDDSAHLWIVMEGQVDLRFDVPGISPTKVDTVSFISEAQVFGWSSLVPHYKYRLSGYCTSRKCKVCKVDKNLLADLFEQDPKAGYQVMSHLIRVVGKQFHQFQDELAKHRGHNIMHGW